MGTKQSLTSKEIIEQRDKKAARRTNILKGDTLTNINYWFSDVTFFDSLAVGLVVSSSSRAIYGFVVGQSLTSAILGELVDTIITEGRCASPEIIHVDLAKIYTSADFQRVLKKHNIKLSQSHSKSHQNQVIESIINVLKGKVAFSFFNMELTTWEKGERRKELKEAGFTNSDLKQNTKIKSKRKSIREKAFKTTVFKKNLLNLLKQSVEEYNKDKGIMTSEDPISRNEHDFLLTVFRLTDVYNVSKYQGKPTDPGTLLLKAGTEVNLHGIQKMAQKIIPELKETDKNLTTEKVLSIVSKELNGDPSQNLNKMIMLLLIQGFSKSFEKQDDLKETLQSELQDTRKLLKEVTEELKLLTDEKRRKEENRLKRLNRKLKKQRSLIDFTKLKELLTKTKHMTELKYLRKRLACVLLYSTGVRISELLILKRKNLKTLWHRKNPCFSYEILKQKSPKAKRAYLTNPGKTLFNLARKDFQILSEIYVKNDEDFIFSPRGKAHESLSREHFNREINSYLKEMDYDEEYFRSHSFRATKITELWKEEKDIEFVRRSY